MWLLLCRYPIAALLNILSENGVCLFSKSFLLLIPKGWHGHIANGVLVV